MLVAVENMVSGQVLCPDSRCLLIACQSLVGGTLEDGYIQVFGVDMKHIYDILPREVNRPLFEVVAKRPVAEHLEHRVVVGIVPHLLQVVVLTAHAKTLLRVSHTRVLNRVIA